MIQISVIIPVYNAAEFVSKAIESALNQPQTAEVILIEDGSLDDSFAVCSALAKSDTRIQFYHHPNRANMGASATRNLGIEKSRFPFIAFLDADDYYLPERFKKAEAIFNQYRDADGVYEAVSTEFVDEKSRQHWLEAGRDESLTTVTKEIAPEALLEALLFDRHGAFHTNGVTFKREIFERSGLFDLDLRLHQDTALWLKISATSRLYSGDLRQPVAVRRVHLNNRISAKRTPEQIHQSTTLLGETVWRWSEQNPNLTPKQQSLFFEYYLRRAMTWHDPTLSRLGVMLKSRLLLLQLLSKHPQFMLKSQFWAKFLPSAYH